MHEAVLGLVNTASETPAEMPGQEFTPATTVRRSLASKDHIISLIDGKPDKTLRRHLSTHGLTPEQYRERYKLKADYPMVAPNYSEARRAMAKTIGLGRKPGAGIAAPTNGAEPVRAPARRGRKPNAAGAAPLADAPKRSARKPKAALAPATTN